MRCKAAAARIDVESEGVIKSTPYRLILTLILPDGIVIINVLFKAYYWLRILGN